MEFEKISWEKFGELVSKLAKEIKEKYKVDAIVGVGKSGFVPAAILAKLLNIGKFYTIAVSFYDEGKPPKQIFDTPKILEFTLGDLRNENVLIVDDFVHTGSTLEVVREELKLKGAKDVQVVVVALRKDAKMKPEYYAITFDKCVIFPWDLKE